MATSGIAVGIDLGTSNSCVAVMGPEGPRVLSDNAGHKVQGSVVHFGPDGQVVVGNAAKALLSEHPARTVVSSKRLIGRFHFSDEVQRARSRCGYKLVEGPNSSVQIEVAEERYTPQDIAGLILKKMKMVAEEALAEPVDQAVITVPAYFNDNQRQATRDAGRISGLKVLRIINEPTAAALAYGYGIDAPQRVAVYDLGGGTFDVSILEIGAGIYEVLSTAGDTYLGGDDIDERLTDFLANAFYQEHGVDVRELPDSFSRLQQAAEVGKRSLSAAPEHVFSVPALVEQGGRTLDLTARLTQGELARMSMDLMQRTFKVCDEALQAARMVPADLDGVVLVGGPTRLPFVRGAVEHYFQRQAHADVNPDEVVALGAALQAHTLVSPEHSAVLLDVTPLTLRLATVGGYTEEIIPKNTPIPIERTRTFTTARDNQDRVQVVVLQGEERQQEKCEMLGHFEFAGLRPAPRGEVEVEVTFEIDVNGIVNVSAKDRETGRGASTEIKLSSGLTEEDIEASRTRTEQSVVAVS